MTKKKEIKDLTLNAPTKKVPVLEIDDTAQLDNRISELANTGRNLLAMETERDAKIAKIKEEYEKQMLPLRTIAAAVFEAVIRFSQKHRAELLPPDVKSVDFTNGTIGWRLNPASIKLTVEEEFAVDFLKASGHKNFIRTKEVLDLEALGKDPDFVRSLSIFDYKSGFEYFFVKPHGVQVNFTRRMKALADKARKAGKSKK